MNSRASMQTLAGLEDRAQTRPHLVRRPALHRLAHLVLLLSPPTPLTLTMGLLRKLTGRSKQPSTTHDNAPVAGTSYAPPPSAPPPASSSATPRSQAQGAGYGAPLQLSQAQENALAALSKHDTVFLVDDSGSMEMVWETELAPALASVVRTAAAYDDDGIDLCFFNSSEQCTSKSADEILAVFRRVQPRYSTPTARAVKRVLEPYMQRFEDWHSGGKAKGQPRPKPLNLIILTGLFSRLTFRSRSLTILLADGAPDRDQSPEMVIVDIAKRLDQRRAPPFQVGISFVQIGNDEQAAEHLRSLDDDLKEKHGIRDMVDTTLFQGQNDAGYLLKALLGGINRSIDKQ
ncbi:hypothetical protein JCM8097_005790 [Rhodosporidiobolus ruineniae]